MNVRAFLVVSLATLCLSAETVPDRAGAVRNDRLSMEQNPLWIYNDWQAGFSEARKTGKPLLVVLRCVPCLACAGIDASVLEDRELQPLLEKFVCVRVMNANALDLSLFQFDYDLSFSTVFFNGDGTVYGRYGSWQHQKESFNKTTAGFRRALLGALAVHQGYPANRESLRGKQGMPMPVKDPLQLPELSGKYKRELDWDGKVVQSCVHCHQISDAVRSSYRDQGKKIPQKWVYPMPAPETIGLALAADEGNVVESVQSIAKQAGFKAGDVLLTLENQPIFSVADVAWVLHNAPDAGALSARVKRGQAEQDIQVTLPDGWRMKSDISRRVGTWAMRAMAGGGLQLSALSPEERRQRGIADREMALLVKHAGEYGKHRAAKNAGFRKDDVIVAMEGISGAVTESELIGRLLEDHDPGDKVRATVLRGDQRLQLLLPIQ